MNMSADMREVWKRLASKAHISDIEWTGFAVDQLSPKFSLKRVAVRHIELTDPSAMQGCKL